MSQEIPSIAQLAAEISRKNIEEYRRLVDEDIAVNSEKRTIELRAEVIKAITTNGRAKGHVTLVVADAPITYPPASLGTTTLKDFGSHFVAAEKVESELRQKGYETDIHITENRRSSSFVEDDALILRFSW